MIFPGFCDASSRSALGNFAFDRCINVYPETGTGNSKSKRGLIRVPGLGGTLVTLPDDPVRCLWAQAGRLFTVAGAKYGEVVAGVFSDRGTVSEDSDNAYIFSNGNQLLIISGSEAYYDLGGAASGANAVVISDGTPMGAVSSGEYIDGYGVLVEKDTNKVFISSLLDFSTWDNLDFAERTDTVDRIRRVVNHGGNLWIFGEKSITQWYNSGNADYPFQPIRGATLRKGTIRPDTIVSIGESLYFAAIDDNGGAQVYRTRGSALEQISHPGIEFMITLGQPIGWSYTADGHSFYVLINLGVFGGGIEGSSLFYDITEGVWHERGHWNGTGFDPYLGRCHAFDGIDHFVGARNSGKIYKQATTYNTFDGTEIRVWRRVRLPDVEEKRQFISRFEVDIQTGTQASGTPNAELSWSKDGGSTFTSPRVLSLGASGDYTKRVYANRLGSSRQWMFDLVLPEGGKTMHIAGAYLDMVQGNS